MLFKIKRNAMKFVINNIFMSVIVIFMLTWSCTDEEDDIKFKSAYRNESTVSLKIMGYNSSNEEVYNYSLMPGERGIYCETLAPSFGGANCGADSIFVRFENGRGYICVSRPNANEFCFENSPLTGVKSDFNEVSPNTFEYVITQEDFENAFELPE